MMMTSRGVCYVIVVAVSWLFSKSSAMTHTTHLTQHGCVKPGSMTHAVFTQVVSRVQCVIKCRYTPGCVAVALDRGPTSLQCALLDYGGVPVEKDDCGDSEANVVIYRDPDVEITTTTMTTTTTPTTTATLSPTTSCHCVYDQDFLTDDHNLATQTCADLGGFLPEADTPDRLQVGRFCVWTFDLDFFKDYILYYPREAVEKS